MLAQVIGSLLTNAIKYTPTSSAPGQGSRFAIRLSLPQRVQTDG